MSYVSDDATLEKIAGHMLLAGADDPMRLKVLRDSKTVMSLMRLFEEAVQNANPDPNFEPDFSNLLSFVKTVDDQLWAMTGLNRVSAQQFNPGQQAQKEEPLPAAFGGQNFDFGGGQGQGGQQGGQTFDFGNVQAGLLKQDLASRLAKNLASSFARHTRH